MKKKILFLCAGLVVLAATIMVLKIAFLQFHLLPSDESALWLLDFKANFTPQGGPVKAALRLPAEIPGFRLAVNGAGKGFAFSAENKSGDLVAEWTADNPAGEQELRCAVKLIPAEGAVPPVVMFPEPGTAPGWVDPADAANAEAVWKAYAAVAKKSDAPGRVSGLIKFMHKRDNRFICALLPDAHSGARFAETVCKLLAMKGVAAVPVAGVYLADGTRKAQMQLRICVLLDGKSVLFDPTGGGTEPKSNFIVLKSGDTRYFQITGARKIKTSVSALQTTRSASEINRLRGNSIRNAWLLDLLGYNLPIEEQNVFKKLAMLPLAILVLVVIRNMIGLQTMGTFMPVLIALAFLETGLAVGLLAFGGVLAAGLLARRGLAALHLLLVPRISAVVIIVIMLMKILSIVSGLVGFNHGAAVTFFPLIIIAWTIERASMVWEEDGAGAALKQLLYSLVACIPCYYLMSSSLLQYIFFTFPEMNLAVLAAVILIGTYTGFRLVELRRFNTLVQP